MTDNEKIVIEKREKAYERVVNSLLNLVNVITEERDYYCNRCSEIHEMTSDYRQAINDVMLIIENVKDGDLDYIVHKLENMLEKNEKYSNT